MAVSKRLFWCISLRCVRMSKLLNAEIESRKQYSGLTAWNTDFHPLKADTMMNHIDKNNETFPLLVKMPSLCSCAQLKEVLVSVRQKYILWRFCRVEQSCHWAIGQDCRRHPSRHRLFGFQRNFLKFRFHYSSSVGRLPIRKCPGWLWFRKSPIGTYFCNENSIRKDRRRL